MNSKIANTKILPENFPERIKKMPLEQQAIICVATVTGLNIKNILQLKCSDFIINTGDVKCVFSFYDKRHNNKNEIREEYLPVKFFKQYILPQINEAKKNKRETIFHSIKRDSINREIKKIFGNRFSFDSARKYYVTRINAAFYNAGINSNLMLIHYLKRQMNISRYESLLPFLFESIIECEKELKNVIDNDILFLIDDKTNIFDGENIKCQ